MNSAADPRPAQQWFERPLFDRVALRRLLWLYPLAWSAVFLVSDAFWYLPAGVRLAALLTLAPRHWIWLALAEYLSILLLQTLWLQPHPHLLANAVGVIAPWLVFAGVIGLWLRSGGWRSGESPQALGGLLAVCATASAMVAIVVALANVLAGVLRAEDAPLQLFSYMVGDYVGILVLTPLLCQIGDPKAAWRSAKVWRDLSISIVPLAAMLLAVALAAPQVYPYFSLLLLVPTGWMSYRAGWRGAAMAVALVGFALYATGHLVGTELDATYIQLLLAVAGSMALLSGAWIAYEGRLRAQMLDVNQDLAEANDTLLAQSEQLKTLGRRLLRAQELERRRIRSDLRDELSQHLSALNSQLAMMAREVERPELLARIDVIRTYVQSVRDAADECIDQLQPRAMMSLPLREALLASLPLTAMSDSGIDHSVDLGNSDHGLGHGDRIAIFRVVQLLSAFTLRLPGASHFRLQIEIGQPESRSQVRHAHLRAIISMRHRFNLESLAALDEWQSLQDRINALGGYCRLEQDNDVLLNIALGFPLSDDDL